MKDRTMERSDEMKRKKAEKTGALAAQCQMRSGYAHPFGSIRGYIPLGGNEERMYRQIREAVPVLDAAVEKLVRLSSGFDVKCPTAENTRKLQEFLAQVNCGRGQQGIDSFLAAYIDSLLTYGRAVGEMVVAGGHLAAVCWGDVTALEVQEGENPLEVVLWGMDGKGQMRPLPYQNLLLFTSYHPEPAHPYGVSLIRGMPFFADILMKIYHTMGVNWERAGNVRYSVICKPEENLDPVTAQERGNQIAREWARPWKTERTAWSGISLRWEMWKLRSLAPMDRSWIRRPRYGRFWSSWWRKPDCRPFCWASAGLPPSG